MEVTLFRSRIDAGDIHEHKKEPENNSGIPINQRNKRHNQDDLHPYSDDMFSHLTGEDIPDITTDDVDDLLIGNDSKLPPEARQCPIAVRRLIRNAHQSLGPQVIMHLCA